MSNWTQRFQMMPGNPPSEGELFANHEPLRRSGHLGHALVEYEPGKLLAFYASCDAGDSKWNGHSGYGWMEYRRSTDGGKTWSEPIMEPNSKAMFERHCGRTLMCEKAVCASDGTIILYYLTCDMETNGHRWAPFFEPHYAVSHDGGETFSEPKMFVHEAGRIWDVLNHDGQIYVLFADCPELPGIELMRPYKYRLYVSEDNGATYTLRSELPFESTVQCVYGTMEFGPDGKLIAYIYDKQDEHNLKYLVSEDAGRSWGVNRRAFFEKKLRNPQLVYFAGGWWIHGRSGNLGQDKGHFVLYHSEDGVEWDRGSFVRLADQGLGAYSNNLVVHCPDGRQQLLIQASHAYDQNRTNVYHWWLKEKETISRE